MVGVLEIDKATVYQLVGISCRKTEACARLRNLQREHQIIRNEYRELSSFKFSLPDSIAALIFEMDNKA
jgi:hypothetical protein